MNVFMIRRGQKKFEIKWVKKVYKKIENKTIWLNGVTYTCAKCSLFTHANFKIWFRINYNLVEVSDMKFWNLNSIIEHPKNTPPHDGINMWRSVNCEVSARVAGASYMKAFDKSLPSSALQLLLLRDKIGDKI